MKNIFLLCLAFLMFGTFSVQAQKSNSPKKAEKLYQNLGYLMAADAYSSASMSGKTLSRSDMMRLAESYRLNSAFEDASYWYGQFVSDESDPITKWNYAQVLQSSGDCERAIKWFNSYNSESDETARLKFVASCEEAKTMKAKSRVEITNVEALNSANLDFSATAVGDGVVFTSTRPVGKMSGKDKWTKQAYSDLFYAKKNEDGTYSIEHLGNSVNAKYHDGVVAFDPSGTTMFFTRSNQKGKSKSDVIDLKIYTASKNGDSWKVNGELPFNSKEFATAHPTLTANGRKLYFSSNRPGGMGGMDLYVSEKVGGLWQQPKNLGSEINTSANEVFPHITSTGVLYFSSNGHKGIGGLDIFKAEMKDDQWSSPKNLGSPFNSKKDDFGFTAAKDNKSGFLSSNRDGGLGGDDIYEWTAELIEMRKAQIIVVETGTEKTIEKASVVLNCNDGNTDSWTTNGQGAVNTEFSDCGQMSFVANKRGYLDGSKMMNWSDLDGNPIVKIYLTRKPFDYNGAVVSAGDNTAIPNANVRITNNCTGKSANLRADGNGQFNFSGSCDCSYKVEVTKEGYSGNNISYEVDCATVMKVKPAIVALDKVATPKYRVGEVIRLNKVYYDFNKYYIRPDAARELNHVVDLMNQYPSMKIELSSHTDARGSDTYNETLSQNRANSAVEYIIKQGISSSRIVARGYGETQLVNECANGVNCSDEAHQENRRTEIKITAFDEEGVRVAE